jgi:hypothetical protein
MHVIRWLQPSEQEPKERCSLLVFIMFSFKCTNGVAKGSLKVIEQLMLSLLQEGVLEDSMSTSAPSA